MDRKVHDKKYRQSKPWLRHWHKINYRIKHNPYYKNIKNLLSKDEIEELWIVYDAHLLNRPSLDRLDSKGNYTFENCRFIEFCENARRATKERYDKRSNQDFCKNGHQYLDSNSIWYGPNNNYRRCKQCRIEQRKKSWRTKKV